MSERVYRLGRGPRQHKGVGFGVSQAARTAKSQVNIGVLTAMEVEVAIGVCGVTPVPMGIGRMDKHEGAGLHTWKGSKAAKRCWIWGQPGC